jgi:hypothetical protein
VIVRLPAVFKVTGKTWLPPERVLALGKEAAPSFELKLIVPA